jgi:ATP-binding cassette subfamily C protein
VDVFVSVADERLGFGRRHHMFRLKTGSLLFGLPPMPGLTVQAVCAGASALEPVARQDVFAECGEVPPAVSASRAFERWINRLSEFIAIGFPPSDTIVYDADCEGYEAPSRCIRPASGVVCLEMVSGEAKLFGQSGATVSAPAIVALSTRAWLHTTAESRFRMVRLPAAPDAVIWRALETLHGLLVDNIRARMVAIAAAERERHAVKSASATTASAAALAHIVATFHGADADAVAAPQPPAATSYDRLNAMCRIVAARSGVRFTTPANTTYTTMKDGVASVARASKFRTRQIRLDGQWWRDDQGPLLGLLKEQSQPVALLPRRRSGYEMVDATGAPGRVVNADIAKLLSPNGYTFYRPFPSGPLGFAALVKFAAFGCGRELATVVIAGALVGVVGMAVPIATGVLINSTIPSTDRSQLAQWIVILLVCAAASTMFQITRSIALVRLEMKLAYAVQAAVWDRLISLPARFFRQYTAGNLATRAMGVDAVRERLSGATIRAILGGVFSVFNFGLLFFYNRELAVYATGLIGLALMVFASIAYFQRMQQRELVALQAKTSGVVLQLLTGIRKLRVAGAEMRALEIWARLFSTRRRAIFRVYSLRNAFRVFQAAFPLVSYCVLFSILLRAAEGEQMQTGDFLAFLAAFTACIHATLATAVAAIDTLSIVPHYEMAKPILQAEPEVGLGQTDPGPLKGNIALDQVTFRYRPDAPPVLNDITCRINAGEFVAFVGPSGSGKSTILRLLLGFERPESGAIFFDGRDLADLDTGAVRRKIGVVLQSGRLMPGDLFTNIVGCSSATMEDAWTACRWAGLEDDIKKMPMGMHTMVADGGSSLSGGQRQRLMIARAIVTRPNVLLFDEATSALDNQTQATVAQSLSRLRATRIVIAHRLSTIVDADRIVVVEKGRIVQSGTYEELIAQSGLFAELVRRQVA